jgi:hypothetical protein
MIEQSGLPLKKIFWAGAWMSFFLLLALPPSALAGYLKKSPWTREAGYSEKTINKLGFGLMNFMTGWTDLFFEPYREKNLFTGLLKGTWKTITNTAGGALHAVTFPIPMDIPLPEGGVRFEPDPIDEKPMEGP